MNRAHHTHDTWQPQTKVERDAVLSELETILASAHFCNSKRYPAFLRYVVENALAGRAEQLKERTLGIEVFDRPPTFDTNSDTVVRYTAGEVRKRLLLYYSEHGQNSTVRISLPAGSYIPEFAPEHAEGTEPAAEQESASAHSAAASNEHVASESHEAGAEANAAASSEHVGEHRSSRRWIPWTAALVLLVAAVAGIAFWKLSARPGQTLVDRFWEPVLRDKRTVIVCTGSVVFANNNYSGVITANKDIEYSFVSIQNASAIAQISSTLARAGVAMQMAPAPSTPLTELSDHPVVLLGGYNNRWTMRLLEPLRFHFSPPAADEIILDRLHPGLEWQRDRSLPYSNSEDYAIVARYREATTGGWVIAVAGIGRNGTEAAARFITNDRSLQLLRDSLGSDFANHNLEAILKVTVIDGKTGSPSLLAVHTW